MYYLFHNNKVLSTIHKIFPDDVISGRNKVEILDNSLELTTYPYKTRLPIGYHNNISIFKLLTEVDQLEEFIFQLFLYLDNTQIDIRAKKYYKYRIWLQNCIKDLGKARDIND